MHLAGGSVYLEVRVDGGDLAGAAGRHAGPDDLNGRVRGGLLQGGVSRAHLSIAGQPGGAAACLQVVWGKGRQGGLACFIFELSKHSSTQYSKGTRGAWVAPRVKQLDLQLRS